MTTIYLVVEETKFWNTKTMELEFKTRNNWKAFTKEKDAREFIEDVMRREPIHKTEGITRIMEIQKIELD